MVDHVQPLVSLSKKPTEPKIRVNLRHIKRKIMILSGKGGVGKSTVAANLAIGLALHGYRVGLLDCDIHGPTIPTIFGLESKRLEANEEGILPIKVLPNLSLMSIGFLLENKDSPIIWRGPAKMGAIKQFLEDVIWGELDFLIIDLPPGTGDEPLSVAQLIPNIDGSVIVTTPQDMALISVRKSIGFSEKLQCSYYRYCRQHAWSDLPSLRQANRSVRRKWRCGKSLKRFQHPYPCQTSDRAKSRRNGR